MKKLKALFSSIILRLFIFNNLMSIITYAADNKSTENKEQEEIGRVYEIKEEETWDVSKNGDGSVIAKWTLNNRTLTISSSGEMKDWWDEKNEDWHGSQYTKIIEKVTIENGITKIGKYTFEECSRLTNVEIPSSVASIGRGLFWMQRAKYMLYE